jgi:hypothetical protein
MSWRKQEHHHERQDDWQDHLSREIGSGQGREYKNTRKQ